MTSPSNIHSTVNHSTSRDRDSHRHKPDAVAAEFDHVINVRCQVGPANLIALTWFVTGDGNNGGRH
jgi:hypothetical protein